MHGVNFTSPDTAGFHLNLRRATTAEQQNRKKALRKPQQRPPQRQQFAQKLQPPNRQPSRPLALQHKPRLLSLQRRHNWAQILGTDSGNHSSIGRTILRILLVLVLLAAVIAAPFLLRMWALQKRTEQFHAADRKKAILWMYAYWERLLETVSIRAGNESVLAFSKTAAQKLQEQQLPSDNTAPFCELVSAVNFGGATPSAEACAAAEQALQQLAEAIYQAKSPLQKLYFKYIQHLI